MMRKRYHILLAVVASVMLLGACEYRDLEGLSVMEKADFVLDFSHDRVDSVPMEYRVAFYPADERTRENITMGYMLFDLLNKRNTLSLPVGNYRVTAWNHDTEHIQTSGYGNREEVKATTQQYHSRGVFDTPKVIDSLYQGQKILDYPDYMVHANVESFTLQSGTLGQSLVLHPDSMVISMYIEIGGIRGMQSVVEARGCINNVPGTRYIAADNLTKDTVVVMFDCQLDADQNKVRASFYLFGLNPTDHPDLEHQITLFFWLPNGKVYIPLDVTNLLRSMAGKRNVKVDIPDLDIDLREYITPSNGYSVEVDGWDNVLIGVDL